MKNKPAVHEIINNRWREVDFSWKFNGKTFYVDAFKSVDECMKAPIHKFIHKYKDIEGKQREWHESFRIGFHNGKLVWFAAYHYFPQLSMWAFEDVNKEPTGYHYCGNAKSVRPIYNDRYKII